MRLPMLAFHYWRIQLLLKSLEVLGELGRLKTGIGIIGVADSRKF